MKVMREIPLFVQLASLVLHLIGETSEDILKELDKKVSSPQSSFKTKKLVELLPFPLARKYYKFEGVSSPYVLLLHH